MDVGVRLADGNGGRYGVGVQRCWRLLVCVLRRGGRALEVVRCLRIYTNGHQARKVGDAVKLPTMGYSGGC